MRQGFGSLEEGRRMGRGASNIQDGVCGLSNHSSPSSPPCVIVDIKTNHMEWLKKKKRALVSVLK